MFVNYDFFGHEAFESFAVELWIDCAKIILLHILDMDLVERFRLFGPRELCKIVNNTNVVNVVSASGLKSVSILDDGLFFVVKRQWVIESVLARSCRFRKVCGICNLIGFWLNKAWFFRELFDGQKQGIVEQAQSLQKFDILINILQNDFDVEGLKLENATAILRESRPLAG